MNIKVKLECECCNQIYKDPVTLICCGGNICKQHINDFSSISNTFRCPFCHQQNQNQNLNINKFIQGLLENHLGHKAHGQINENLKMEIGNLEKILKHPESYIFKQISELKRQVTAEKEKHLSKIDQLSGDLFRELETYELKFISECRQNIGLEAFKDLLESSKNKLAEFEGCLSLFADREDRVEKANQCQQAIYKLQSKIKEAKNKLFANLCISYEPNKNGKGDSLGELVKTVNIF